MRSALHFTSAPFEHFSTVASVSFIKLEVMLKKLKKTGAKEEEIAAKRQKKEKEKELEKELELIPDVFDPCLLVDPKTDVCAMCRGGHDVGLKLKEKVVVYNEEDDELDDDPRLYDADCVLDVNGVWASKYSIVGSGKLMKPRIFVHYFCALSSPQVSFNGSVWANVMREVRRGRMLNCRSCGTKGATLGCLENRCNVVMHIPCAVKLGFRRSGFKVAYYCEEHLQANAEKELSLDRQVAGDISKGLEPVPVTAVNTLDTAKVTDAVRYTTINLDSDDVTMNARSVAADCCRCEGLCDDVAACDCLAPGRNYTFTGGLIPGTDRRILECNIRCACSVRRCTNRVVERGPTSRLEIFRIRSSGFSFRPTQNTWGVRTLDFIPRNAFVCEVTGQYVLGRTAEGTAGSVADTILRGALAGSAGLMLRAGQEVTPVRAWDASAGHDGGLSALSWASSELRLADVTLPSSGVAALVERGELSRALTEQELLRSDEHLDRVRSFLQGEVCVDSRVFGNVGSFIRRRPHRPGPAASATQQTSSAGEAPPPAASARAGDMLLRRLVYTNKRDTKAGLKLALFAACDIPANTELLI